MTMLHASNLPAGMTEEELKTHFSGSGKVLSVSLNPGSSGLEAYVEMEDADAKNAQQQLNGKKIGEQKISVDFASDNRADGKDAAVNKLSSTSKALNE